MADEILLIDPDKSHADALSIYLKRQRFDVSVANSVENVLILFDNLTPGILIADPFLPDNGIINFLKQIKKSHPVTQIIVTADPDYYDKVIEELQSDAIAYLEKPIKSHLLDLALKQARELIRLNKKLDLYAEKLADLHNAQNLYQQLFDEVPCYISVQDRQFRLTATNRMFKKDFGNEIGSHCYEIYKHRTSRCPECPVAATFEDGDNHQTEEIVTSKSGKHYNTLTWTAPIKDSKGNITQVIEMSTNITQIRQLQDHLTSLGLMLGSMSHGVKGMLTAMDGGIYQLEAGIANKDDARIAKAFDQVKNITDKIKNMVLDILYYAKSRALKYQSVDVNNFAESIKDMVEPIAEKNNIDFNADISPSLGEMEVDATWVKAALVNFIENAVDACTYDRSKSEHHVDFKVCEKRPDRICFEIRDNGMGMDQETKDKMFTLFFTSKGSQGTGLGLFIANRVITQHGGWIVAESKLKEGSWFQICLPRKRPDKHRIVDFPDMNLNNSVK
ncbi:MAG: response regulator [Deltaproteobacteria bacterium]|nr:response regulator [Deltaproteobacteria bacterium]